MVARKTVGMSILLSSTTIPRRPIPGLLGGLSAGERYAILLRYLVIIRTAWPVVHFAPPIADDRAICGGV